MMGLLVAPVEWVGGKVVLNQLSKVASTEAAKSGIKSLLKSIGAQAATNFTTEAAKEALNIVSELAVMQDKSQAVQYYNDYLQKHPGSESMALVDTMMQQLARIGQAGLAGAVAGGMMGAAATLWHRTQIEQMGHAAQADAQAIVQEGLSYGEGTQAYQQATEINQQMKEGEQPGDIQLGGLVETNAATDLDQQQITSALQSRDGQPVDNEGQAGYAGNKVEGEGIDRDTHTDSGGTEAPAEPTAPQTESVQQSESAEAGQNAGAEGNSFHQGVGDAAEGAGDVLENANFAQNTYRSRFSVEGQSIYSDIAGTPIKTVDDLVSALRKGLIETSDVPIDYIIRDGNMLLLNTRSAHALMQAGIPRSQWNAVNRTGIDMYETMLDGQLKNNGLTSTGTPTARMTGGH